MNKIQLKDLIVEVINDVHMITPYTAWKENHEASTNTNSFKKFIYQAYESAKAEESRRLEKAFPELFVNKTIES